MDEEFGQPLTIVIHPGSRFLRIGLNYDSKPKKILHVIARRRTAGGRSHRDSFLVPEHPMVRGEIESKWKGGGKVSYILMPLH
ncbi:unnamed protein product [Cyprideis torosa]|uniref:Uncharacterized protein n=1 Tax=Cyprideis torosa TaxID=163714 RepID=A0A7R8ZQ47_9CRUS|nr:unnamed protein product [Cyprideis torosa]CAG0895459.1 unnamed protein product [Cyprideis torosa]